MATNDSIPLSRTHRPWATKLFVYTCVVILGYTLMPTIWGLTNGIVLSVQIAGDPGFQKEIAGFFTTEEIGKLQKSFFNKIPSGKRAVVKTVVEKYLRGVAWLPNHFFSNFITFAVLGLILGLFRMHRQWFIIPICLIPATLTILNGSTIVNNWGLTLAAVFVVQVGTVYFTARFGRRS